MNSTVQKVLKPTILAHGCLRGNRASTFASFKAGNIWKSTSFHEHYETFSFPTKKSNYSELHEQLSSNWKRKKYYKSSFVNYLGLLPLFIIFSFLGGVKIVYCKAEAKDKNKIPDEESKTQKKSKNSSESQTKKEKEDFENDAKKKTNSETQPEKESIKPNQDLQPLPSGTCFTKPQSLTLKEAIDKARVYVVRKQAETGAPGMTVSVSINGKTVWSEGFGYSDLENGIKMSPGSVMRIASISKSLTTVAIGQLIEKGKLDLDAPVQKYVENFPEKKYKGEKVTITTRHLLTHSSGIRHYKLKDELEKVDKDSSSDDESTVKRSEKILDVEEKRNEMRAMLAEKALKTKNKPPESCEFDLEEYYIKEEFISVKEALKLFQDDELLFKPGENYYYSSHAYTLVSAVIEKVSGKPFTKYMTNLFKSLNMDSTFLDEHDPIIYRRGRYYVRDTGGNLKNAPYVSNSYKWAGGGFVSNVNDLVNFGNIMLYSYQNTNDQDPKGFLKSSTVQKLWTPSPESKKYRKGNLYGLGWGVLEGSKDLKAFANNKKKCFSHSGGAVGASSILFIMPTYDPYESKPIDQSVTIDLPQGVVVSVITNLQNVSLLKLATEIAKAFDRVPNDPKILGNIASVLKSKVYSLEKL
ncbi:UNVERIFIED_CONTAM: hypothetical protein RMT77_005383 [Armadillidium vulgare]